ncbi:MAG: transcription antitermination factor NusB [Hyphomicrobiales bacterium]|nr:transcription antitermination factor NusB [Hyphomicrobiales bacterium]
MEKRAFTPKPGMLARRFAARLCGAVLRERRPLDDAFAHLAQRAPFNGLEPRDKGFARAIALTALRRRGQLEDILARFVEKEPPVASGTLRDILITSAAQLAFMGAPPHAVIDLAVDLTKADPDARRFANLVNAVLRRVAAEGAGIAASQNAEALNTPDWLWLRWRAHYGVEEARRIAAQHMAEAALDLTVKSDPAGWAATLGGVVSATGGVRVIASGMVSDLPGYAEGEWWVQDAAATLPARMLGPLDGRRVADLCAAPGGKTAQLAFAGASVVAVDRSSMRLERLRENLARLRLSAETVAADAALWRPDERFDAVLLDAPCSATGTLRRNPDIAALKSEADVAALAPVQARLIDNACALLKPGGVLVYCTCSLEPEEGEWQARKAADRLDLVPAPVAADEDDALAPHLTGEGWLRTTPGRMPADNPNLAGMDGFFAARFVKKA